MRAYNSWDTIRNCSFIMPPEFDKVIEDFECKGGVINVWIGGI